MVNCNATLYILRGSFTSHILLNLLHAHFTPFPNLYSSMFLMPFKHSQNQIQTFQKWDLDIKTHRERMEKEKLDKQFKDADSKLRVVFVCVMWLTRFVVKTLSCLHIEKPIHLPSIHIIHQRPRQSRRR